MIRISGRASWFAGLYLAAIVAMGLIMGAIKLVLWLLT
jgi:hypothetical protein